MENKLTYIKERILKIAENKGISKEKFFEKIGMTYGNFKGKSKETPINSNAIADILTIYPDINLSWLITGKGSMFIEEPSGDQPSKEQEKQVDTRPLAVATQGFEGIPLIPIDAMAGVALGEVSVLELDCERYVIPMFRDADYLISVKGSSMIPKYNNGDVVACKIVPLQDIFFQWNKVYVLDTVQGALIKRVQRGKDDEHILLVSENEKYPPFELHRSKINALSIVVGVVRME